MQSCRTAFQQPLGSLCRFEGCNSVLSIAALLVLDVMEALHSCIKYDKMRCYQWRSEWGTGGAARTGQHMPGRQMGEN